ncbi:hypothetical protein QG516_20985 [Pedobacter gandavensis]|uniref:hypothetical protein n=1 Tax=Pedobacter gandavensis TaxID=2679963 RepID=UPI002478E31C|nr:hypothetical protein [Pedobacter gandavensis]WGQ08991.1 hypothetical protein QG516_20985 [Pedobacter gandavensis]
MEDLTGTWVLVHPELTTDPGKHQGQIGIITSSDLKKDEVRVGFGNTPVALYSADALLVIKPHNELYRDLLTNVKEMEDQDFKTLLRISMILQNGSPRQLKDALEMVLSSENTLKFGTVSLQDKLGLLMEKELEVHQNTGVSR